MLPIKLSVEDREVVSKQESAVFRLEYTEEDLRRLIAQDVVLQLAKAHGVSCTTDDVSVTIDAGVDGMEEPMEAYADAVVTIPLSHLPKSVMIRLRKAAAE